MAWNHPTPKERAQFAADCKRDGICRFDMESAMRNNIIPPMFDSELTERAREHGNPESLKA